MQHDVTFSFGSAKVCSPAIFGTYFFSVGSSPTTDNAEDLSQYDPGCLTGHKTPSLTLSFTTKIYGLLHLIILCTFT